METFRTIGIDLGITSAHTAVVVDAGGIPLARRQGDARAKSFEALEAAALADSNASTSLRIVIEPTGSAWLPVAVFLIPSGSCRLSGVVGQGIGPAQVLQASRKTNQIDALTLAKMPLVDPGDCLLPLELAEGAAASLNRRVRRVSVSAARSAGTRRASAARPPDDAEHR